jgi:hypothetical protein
MNIKINNEEKLVGVETFLDKKGKMPTHSANERISGDKKELEYEAMLGAWVARMKIDNSVLTLDQQERLSDILPKEVKQTPEQVFNEIVEFINKYKRLPSKSASKRKSGDIELNKLEGRLGGWITTNKKKKFLNIFPEQRIIMNKLLFEYNSKSKKDDISKSSSFSK